MTRLPLLPAWLALSALAFTAAHAQVQSAPKAPWAKPEYVQAGSVAAKLLKDPKCEGAWRNQVRGQLTNWSNNAVTPTCAASENEPSVTQA